MPLLIGLETKTWRLEIAGPERSLPTHIEKPESTRIIVNGDAKLTVLDWELTPTVQRNPELETPPLFFENTRYDFYLQSVDTDILIHLPSTASIRHTLGNLVHYSLDFRNDVGWTEICIDQLDRRVCLKFEVFPLKIDYRSDYVQMRDDVSSIAHNLAMSVLVRTYGLADPSGVANPTLVERLSLIQHLFNDLMIVAEAIARNPHARLERSVKQVPPTRSRRVDSRALERVLLRSTKKAGARLWNCNVELPSKVPEVKKENTFDTAENRYVKALLIGLSRDLQRIAQTSDTGDEDADLSAEQKFFAAIREDVKVMLRAIQKYLLSPYLREVERVTPVAPRSLVLEQHVHYARFARLARLLNGSLSLGGQLLRIGVKDIALLYEYWCFLKLVELLRERFSVEQQNVVRLQRLKATIVLKKGSRSSVQFRDPQTDRKFFLVYNRLFSDLPTLAQRPDNIIQIASETDTFFIFDAKYRLSFDLDYQKRFGGIGPKAEDINTMHRYRDAIALPHPLKTGEYIRGVVREAIVLFPYDDSDAYLGHRFFSSIQQVGIGGLPFLPSNVVSVKDKLETMLLSMGICQGSN